ncbi:tetratricopeptide repeat protein [Bacteroidota bacterium]
MPGSGKKKEIQTGKKKNKQNKQKIKSVSFVEKFPRYGYLLIIALATLLYFQTISFDFTFFDDDFLIFNNYKNLSDIENIDDIFFNNSFLSEYNLGFYRPLQTFSFMIDALIGGQKASIYHLSNLIIHCFTCCAIFFLFKKLKYSPALSLSAAILYTVHPLFVHAVVWLPSRGDLLVALFCILSFIFLIKFSEQKKWGFYLFHVFAFVLATLSKEPALLFPLVLFIWYFLINKNKIISKAGIILILSWIIIDAIWLYMRLTTVGGTLTANDFGIIPLINNLATIPEIIGKFIIPVNIQLMPNFNTLTTISGIIIIILMIALLIFNKGKNNRLLLLGSVWFVILILPGMLYSRNYADIAHIYDYLDHRNYLPMIGFVIVLIESLSSYLSKIQTRQLLGIGIMILLIFSAVTFTNSKKYEDSFSYYNAAIIENPGISYLYFLRANLKKDMSDINGALKDYNETVRLDPENADAFNNRGSLNGMLGNYQQALSDFNKAIKLDPKIEDGYYNRAVIRNILGDTKGALEDYNMVIKQNPNDYMALNERGLARMSEKKFDNAIDDFIIAIQIKPDYPISYYNLGNAYLNLKEFSEAIKNFDSAIQINPDFNEAYLYRGIAKYRSNNFKAGCEDWQKAAELGNKQAVQMFDNYCR